MTADKIKELVDQYLMRPDLHPKPKQALYAAIDEMAKDAASNRLTRIQRECLRIGEEIQRAAGELPESYEIEVFVERGYGCVRLYPPGGDIVTHFADTADGLSHCIAEAIDAAIDAELEKEND